MKIVGFNFNKISVKKDDKVRPKELKMNTNMEIEDLTQTNSDLFKSKEELLVISFKYDIKYEPDFAKVSFKGKVIVSIEPKESKQILKQWKKKEIPEEFRMAIFNVILNKANVKALQLEEELNLPFHVPMPTLRPQEKEK
jgi:hypothetical protein